LLEYSNAIRREHGQEERNRKKRRVYLLMTELDASTKNHINELGKLTLLEQYKYARKLTDEEFAKLVEHWESYEPCEPEGSVHPAELEAVMIEGDVQEKRKRWFY
jgi:hypothetical protein